MEPVNKTTTVKEQTKQVKENAEKQDNVFFVESGTLQSVIIQENDAGKKLIFDITKFPELSMMTIGKLSRENQIAYQMDARYAERAGERVKDGKSPYSEIRKQLEMEDPLGAVTGGSPFEVTDGDPEMKYIFGDPKNVEAMQRAGYKLVDPKGDTKIQQGVIKGDRICILGDNGHVDNVAMQVRKADYDKHMEIQVKKSEAKLGNHLSDTKDRMQKYAPKVTIYDKSKLSD